MSVIITGLQFVKETTQTTGNTDPPFVLTLDGPVSGFEAILSKVGTDNQSYFTLRHGSAWMRFKGTALLSTQLRVDEVVGSSDGGNPLVLGSGIKTVYSSFDEFMVSDQADPAQPHRLWTPHAGDGTTTTYALQVGFWYRIGRVCHISGRYAITTIGDGNTSFLFGLPFPSLNETNYFAGVDIARFDGSATNCTSIRGRISSNSEAIGFSIRTAASANEGSGNIFGNGSDIQFSAAYLIG